MNKSYYIYIFDKTRSYIYTEVFSPDMADPEVIGLIGTGRMGLPMAKNLLEEEFKVIAFDPDSDACQSVADVGTTIAGSPAEVGAQSDTVLITVPTGNHVQDVCSNPDGLLDEIVRIR